MCGGVCTAGVADPENFPRAWTAHWIAPPEAPANSTLQGVFHFRRTFDAPAAPVPFVVHVSADNRYELFINGRKVATGPARGDLAHWQYETVDLQPYLVAGRNVLAAVVWNWGDTAPMAQLTARTAFLVQGIGAAAIVSTDDQWRVQPDRSRTFKSVTREDIHFQYYTAAPGEIVQADRYAWGWESPQFDDGAWGRPHVLMPAYSADWRLEDVKHDARGPWFLVPRIIPAMEEKPQRFSRVRRSTGPVPAAFLAGNGPLLVGPDQRISLLLDQDQVTTAFPELVVSGGRGARIELRYAESLRLNGTRTKGPRDQIEGQELRGLTDVFFPDGGERRVLRSLWWRAFRFVQIDIETAVEPLQLLDVRSNFVAYPYRQQGRFESDAPAWFDRVLEVGRWTNRLSSQETFVDAYYEQLQYIGDSRIEALVMLFDTGDARLMKNALIQFDATRDSSGLTMSRGPANLDQFTPTFSLLWIGMVHDYLRYVDDAETVQNMLPGVRTVLSWFATHQRPDGTLRELPLYNFIDSFWTWNPDKLAPFEFQLLQGYQWAAELEESAGNHALAELDRVAARRLSAALRARYWDQDRQLFADDAAHTGYSQHTNALAVLTDVAEPEVRGKLMATVLAGSDLEPTSLYFRYYVHRAAIKAGLGDHYLDWMGTWRELLDQGVTAWPENEKDDSRSDCHGWGDHPNVEAYRTILGVDSAGPGFSRIRIEPHLGALTRASGTVPTPHGNIEVSYCRTSAGAWEVSVSSPVAGGLVWKAVEHVISPGLSHYTLP